MKKLVVGVILMAALLTGCGGKQTADTTKTEKIENVVLNFREEFEKCKEKEYENLDFAKCNAKISDIDCLYKLEIDEYASPYQGSDRIKNFEEYCKFFFGDYDSSNLLFSTSTPGVEKVADGNYAAYPVLDSYREQIEAGEIDVEFLLYRDTKNYRYLWEMTGDNLPRWMNKGEVFSKLKDDSDKISTWEIMYQPGEIAEYYNDGSNDDVIYNLSGGEVTIGEAIDFVENKYLDTLPFDYGEDVSLEVTSIKVYELGDGIYTYGVIFSMGMHGMAFDSMVNFYTTEQNYKIFASGNLVMTGKESVDMFNGIMPPLVIGETKLENDICTLERAVDIVSETFSSEVKFEVQTISLIYDGVYEKLSPEEASGIATPAWKFLLYNTNDELYYCVYVDALTAEVNYYSYLPVS